MSEDQSLISPTLRARDRAESQNEVARARAETGGTALKAQQRSSQCAPISPISRWAALLLAGACLALCWTPRRALGEALAHVDTPPPSATRSHGLPWDGELRQAARARPSPSIRLLPKAEARGNFYGTAELVGLLERAARQVLRRWPGSPLTIGELSARRGGRIPGHHSHRNGRDADLAFFMRNEAGKPETVWRFVTFAGHGAAIHPRRLQFDDARNWSLVASLLRDPAARVQYIFVAQPIRTRLLMEARRRGESDEFLRIAAAVMVEPKNSEKHDNHFHVRIYCAEDDRPECLDSEPYWPWYEGLPPAGGYAQLPAIHWRTPSTPPPSAPQ